MFFNIDASNIVPTNSYAFRTQPNRIDCNLANLKFQQHLFYREQFLYFTQKKKESQSGRGMTEAEIFASCCRRRLRVDRRILVIYDICACNASRISGNITQRGKNSFSLVLSYH